MFSRLIFLFSRRIFFFFFLFFFFLLFSVILFILLFYFYSFFSCFPLFSLFFFSFHVYVFSVLFLFPIFNALCLPLVRPVHPRVRFMCLYQTVSIMLPIVRPLRLSNVEPAQPGVSRETWPCPHVTGMRLMIQMWVSSSSRSATSCQSHVFAASAIAPPPTTPFLQMPARWTSIRANALGRNTEPSKTESLVPSTGFQRERSVAFA